MERYQKSRAFLDSSLEFYAAFERTSEYWVINDKFGSAYTPAIVCLSFSVELGLKSLHLIEHGKYPKNNEAHHLKNLYDELGAETKLAIENIDLPSYPKYLNPKTFYDYLCDHDDVFKEWRYSCEMGEDLIVNEPFLKNLALKIHQFAQQAIESFSSGDLREREGRRSRLIIK